MWSMGLLMMLALVFLFLGMLQPGLHWMLILAVVFILVSLIAGLARTQEMA